jgi:hypothetical protein
VRRREGESLGATRPRFSLGNTGRSDLGCDLDRAICILLHCSTGVEHLLSILPSVLLPIRFVLHFLPDIHHIQSAKVDALASRLGIPEILEAPR